jgi:hypothetical protein
MMADELWWEIDGMVVLLPRDQWPYQPRRLGVITSIPAEAKTMTEDDLKAIEARANAATPGPWAIVYDGSSDWSIGPQPDPQGLSVAGVWKSGWSDGNPPDAEFIASARTDVPLLVAEVRRLSAENAEMRTVIAAEKNSADAYTTAFDAEVDRRATAEEEVERLRGVVERLGSSEAFTIPMSIDHDHPLAEELRTRLDYARIALKDYGERLEDMK